MTMGGERVECLVTPMTEKDKLKVLGKFHNLKIHGKSRLGNALRIAQLVLKHRVNTNGGQKLVVFVSSPVTESDEDLLKAGRLLSRNNIGVDIINLCEGGNVPKLENFVRAVNRDDNS